MASIHVKLLSLAPPWCAGAQPPPWCAQAQPPPWCACALPRLLTSDHISHFNPSSHNLSMTQSSKIPHLFLLNTNDPYMVRFNSLLKDLLVVYQICAKKEKCLKYMWNFLMLSLEVANQGEWHLILLQSAGNLLDLVITIWFSTCGLMSYVPKFSLRVIPPNQYFLLKMTLVWPYCILLLELAYWEGREGEQDGKGGSLFPSEGHSSLEGEPFLPSDLDVV